MKFLDRFFEKKTRQLARNTSRRSILKGLGGLLVGSAAVPLLPVARAADSGQARPPQETGDPASCDYWRYCALDGYLCECCGGTHITCPAGTEMSPVTWIGTCRNPVDGRHYVISYNDCCGKTSCGSCLCSRDEGDRPLYRSDKANDVNWCLGTDSLAYHCSTAVLIGLAFDKEK